jgi:hypothetical protein
MNMQAKTSTLWTPLRLGLLAGLIGIGVSLESSAGQINKYNRLKISNVSVNEPSVIGNAAEAELTVTLKRTVLNLFGLPNNQTIQPVSVDFKTVDGSANEGSDYDFADGTLIFEGNETTKTITVQVRGDDVEEGTEDLIVQLSNPQNGVLSDGQGQIDINNTPGTEDPDPVECPEDQHLVDGKCVDKDVHQ